MTVAVTGASGHLGRKVSDLLLDRLDPADVVLLTRTPETLAALAERGAVVRHADFAEPSSLVDAFAGVDRALLISAVDLERRAGQHRAAIQAAATAGVREMIYTSIPNPSESNPAAVTPSHRATEEALRDSGLAWTFLRNNLYAEFQIPVVEQAIASGRLVTSAGTGRTAYVSREDCAAAAAAVLVKEGHENRAYDITGPDAISPQDLASLATELGNRPVEVVQVDDDALIAGMIAGGLPEAAARVVASFPAAARKGFLGSVSSAVDELTGVLPTSLRDVVAAGLEEAALS
jgi:NAD(P)H dehydrogenase (quinone)